MVEAAGVSSGDLVPTTRQRLGARRSRHVIVHIIGIEAGRNDARRAGSLELGDIVIREYAALGEVDAVGAPAMRQDRAGGLVDGGLAESHAATTFGPASASSLRARASTIWPRIDTAISAGDLAPMFKPTGPWMCANCSSVMPASASRSLRLAWVRLLPSAPT